MGELQNFSLARLALGVGLALTFGTSACFLFEEDPSALPVAIEEAETAVPGFIGRSLSGPAFTPTRISSLAEYEQLFGGAVADSFRVAINASGEVGIQESPDWPAHLLYHSLRLYFDNGGGACILLSTGGLGAPAPTFTELQQGLTALAQEEEVTLWLVPEAVRLSRSEQAALHAFQCGLAAGVSNAFAILDLPQPGPADWDFNAVTDYRTGLGTQDLRNGAAYTPYLRVLYPPVYSDSTVWVSEPDTGTPALLGSLSDDQKLLVRARLDKEGMILPAGPAVAGLYVRTDQRRGIWKAPAGESLNAVSGPVYPVSEGEQEALNIDPVGGKSINPIRTFTGRGVLVWGSRTLAGNDNEWRYVPVQRHARLMEASIKNFLGAFAGETNDPALWSRVRVAIENYLETYFRAGAFQGSKASDAYFVRVDRGATMSANDVASGRLIVELGFAPLKPAEFIILRIEQQVQGG